MTGQFCRKGGFTGTLQTGNQNYRRISLHVDIFIGSSHQRSQLIMNDLHHHLARLHRGQDFLSHGLLLYIIGKGFGYFIIYVSIKQVHGESPSGFQPH